MPVSAANFYAACVNQRMSNLGNLFYPGIGGRMAAAAGAGVLGVVGAGLGAAAAGLGAVAGAGLGVAAGRGLRAGALAGIGPVGGAGYADTLDGANALVKALMGRINTINNPPEFRRVLTEVLDLNAANALSLDRADTFNNAQGIRVDSVCMAAKVGMGSLRIKELGRVSPQAQQYLTQQLDGLGQADRDTALVRLGSWPENIWIQRKDALITGLQDPLVQNDPTQIPGLFGGGGAADDKFLARQPANVPSANDTYEMSGAAMVSSLATKNPALFAWIQQHPQVNDIYRRIGREFSFRAWQGCEAALLTGIAGQDLSNNAVVLNPFLLLLGQPAGGGGGIALAANTLLDRTPTVGNQRSQINLQLARSILGNMRIAELKNKNKELFDWISSHPQANAIFEKVGGWAPVVWERNRDALLNNLINANIPVAGPVPTVFLELFGGAAAVQDKLLPNAPVVGNNDDQIDLECALLMVCDGRIAQLASKNFRAAEYLRGVINALPSADGMAIRKQIGAWAQVDWERNRDSLLERLVKVDGNNAAAAVKEIFKTEALTPAGAAAPAPFLQLPPAAAVPPAPVAAAAPAPAAAPRRFDGGLTPEQAKEMVGEARIRELAGENAKAAEYLGLAIGALPGPAPHNPAGAKQRIGAWDHATWQGNKKLLFEGLAALPIVNAAALPAVFGTNAPPGHPTRLLDVLPVVDPARFGDAAAEEMIGEARIAELTRECPKAGAYLNQRIVALGGAAAKVHLGRLPGVGVGSWQAKKSALIGNLANAANGVAVAGFFSGNHDKLLVAPIAAGDEPSPDDTNEIRGDARIAVLAQTDDKLVAAVKSDAQWNTAGAKQTIGLLPQWPGYQTALREQLARVDVSANGDALRNIIGNAAGGGLLPGQLAAAPAADDAKQIVGVARVTGWIQPILVGHKAADYFDPARVRNQARQLRWNARIQAIGASATNDPRHWQRLAGELVDRNTAVARLSQICTTLGMRNPPGVAARINAHNQLQFVKGKIAAEGPASLKAAFNVPANEAAVLAQLGTKFPAEVDGLVLQLLRKDNSAGATTEVGRALQSFGFAAGAATTQLATNVAADKQAKTDKVWIHNFYIRKFVDDLSLTLSETQINAINRVNDYRDLQAVCDVLDAQIPGLGSRLAQRGALTAEAEAIFATKFARLRVPPVTPADRVAALARAIRNEQLRQNNYRTYFCIVTQTGTVEKSPAFHEWFSKNETMLYIGGVPLPAGIPAARVLDPARITDIVNWLKDPNNAGRSYAEFCAFLEDPVVAVPPAAAGCGFAVGCRPDKELFVRLKREARLSNPVTQADNDVFAAESKRLTDWLSKAEGQLRSAATLAEDKMAERASAALRNQAQPSLRAVALNPRLGTQPKPVATLISELKEQNSLRMQLIPALQKTLNELTAYEKMLPKTAADIAVIYPDAGRQTALFNQVNSIADKRARLEQNLADIQTELQGAKAQIKKLETKQRKYQNKETKAASATFPVPVVANRGVLHRTPKCEVFCFDANGAPTHAAHDNKADLMAELDARLKANSGKQGAPPRPPGVIPVPQPVAAPAIAPAGGALHIAAVVGPQPLLDLMGWPDNVEEVVVAYKATDITNLAGHATFTDHGRSVTFAIADNTKKLKPSTSVFDFAAVRALKETIAATAAKDLTTMLDHATDVPIGIWQRATDTRPRGGVAPRMTISGGSKTEAREALKMLLAKDVPLKCIDNYSNFQLSKLTDDERSVFFAEVVVLKNQFVFVSPQPGQAAQGSGASIDSFKALTGNLRQQVEDERLRSTPAP